ncbi:MAG: serine/threonine protein kinase [Myxococcaceae bacterium]|nr:serine/threonine protein kinase [Myxococcaceae bacterium]
MAQTFVAMRRGPAGFEQKVCLKRILPEYAMDTALVEQFLDEARLLAALRHANIVQVYDFGEADGSYFMALELIDGADLENIQRYLVSQKLEMPASVALHIVAETLKALHYAHHAELDGEPLHLVHRDISPSNLLLSRAGEVKLADFGIAKSTHRRHKTRAGFTKGKVAYMSPEQVRGGELDGRSDLFAVGIVLHELLTGVHPFDADTDITLLGNILSGTRPNLAALSPPLRPELVRLIDALLATDPAERPDTAVDALSLVPSLEQQFRIERQIGEIVAASVAAKAAKAVGVRGSGFSTPPARPSDNLYGATLSLPAPPQPRPSTPPVGARKPEPPRHTTAEMPGAPGLSELVGTDALMAAQHGQARPSSSNLVWFVAAVALALVGASWLGLHYAGLHKPVVAVQVPDVSVPVRDQLGSDGSAGMLPTQPAAAKPTESPELRDDPASAFEPPTPTSIRADQAPPPFVQPTPGRSHEGHRGRRGEAQSESSRSPRAGEHTPAVPVAETAEPVVERPRAQEKPTTADKPTADQPKKHRAGISISSDDF